MLTFVGEGYTPAFTANYKRIAERLSLGEEIEIVSGPDDICAPLLSGAAAHCHNASVGIRDEAAAAAVGRLVQADVREGVRILPDTMLLRRLRRNFALGTIRNACGGCEWGELCSHVADGGFKAALVDPREVSSRPRTPQGKA